MLTSSVSDTTSAGRRGAHHSGSSNSLLSFRVVGGPIPRDVKIVVQVRANDLVAAIFHATDASLREILTARGSGAKLWENGPVVHTSSFDALQLSLIGGGQGKVVGVLDPDDKVKSVFSASSPSEEHLVLLRPRTTLPPGLPRPPQQTMLRLTTPLLVPRQAPKRLPTPPPPKPDLALRIIGGPIPKDVRIVIKVFQTTTFMDMFPLIQEKVELVAHLAIVSARFYNLYEFEIVKHGKGKKRRALFAKDTPASIGLISNVLMLEQKPLWQHVKGPDAALNDNDGEEDGDDSDNLSEIRPPSATSTLRDRDVDTPPNTIGAPRDALQSGGSIGLGDEAHQGWWEEGAAGENALDGKNAKALTMQALRLQELQQQTGGVAGSRILELVAPENQQEQLIRVIGKPIPRTARVIIEILRTQTFISYFPLIQAKLLEFIPHAQVTPYRYELIELAVLPHGQTKEMRSLRLHDTAWTSDFGLASVILLREIPEGFLKGTEEQTLSNLKLQYGGAMQTLPTTPYGTSTEGFLTGRGAKPSTANSQQSASTMVAKPLPRGTQQQPNSTTPVANDDFFRNSTVASVSHVSVDDVPSDAEHLNSNADARSQSSSHFRQEDVVIPDDLKFDGEMFDLSEGAQQQHLAASPQPPLVVVPLHPEELLTPPPNDADDPPTDIEIVYAAEEAADSTKNVHDDSGMKFAFDVAPTKKSPEALTQPPGYYSSPVKNDPRRVVDIDIETDDDDDAPGHALGSRPSSSQQVLLKPARASSKYLLYQETSTEGPSSPPKVAKDAQLESNGAPYHQSLGPLPAPPVMASLPHTNECDDIDSNATAVTPSKNNKLSLTAGGSNSSGSPTHKATTAKASVHEGSGVNPFVPLQVVDPKSKVQQPTWEDISDPDDD